MPTISAQPHVTDNQSAALSHESTMLAPSSGLCNISKPTPRQVSPLRYMFRLRLSMAVNPADFQPEGRPYLIKPFDSRDITGVIENALAGNKR